MSIDPNDLKKPPTMRTYHLSVKVVVHRHYISDLGKTFERTFVFLVPQENDQRMMFLSAWLPDTPEQHHELVGFLKVPVDSPLRMSVHRKNERYPDNHYLFVMSKGVEDILAEHCEGRTLELVVFPEDQDEVADSSREASGSYTVLS